MQRTTKGKLQKKDEHSPLHFKTVEGTGSRKKGHGR